MQTLWDILHLGRQWKINQASACKNVRAHMRMCVYVFVYRSHSTAKERAPRFCVSKVRAKNRGMVWTCREKRSEADKRRRKHVWTVNKTKTGEDGQKLCQRTVSQPMCWAVSNNCFTVHSLDIYNILLHYITTPSHPVDTSPPTHESQQYQHHLHWHVQWLSIGLISLSLS